MPHSDRCSNPFNKRRHKGKGLRKISKSFLQKLPHLSESSRICHDCRSEIGNASSDNNVSFDELLQDCDTNVETDNISSGNNDTRESFENDREIRSSREIELEEFVSELKEGFLNLDKDDTIKLRILTAAPKSWSIRKISDEFGVSRHFAAKSKELRSAGGVLAKTTARPGRALSSITVDKVKEFYNSDSNGRVMPGMKDTVTVKVDGKRIKVQKHLMLMDLKELYATFGETYPDLKISFSAFAKLRPKHCILAGANGTHCVCVCIIHENCKMMLEAINIAELTKDSKTVISNYKDCLNSLVCENPTARCYIDECAKCPNVVQFGQWLHDIINDAHIYNIQYSCWEGTDRSILQTKTVDVTDYIDELCNKLKLLKPHSYIAKQQAQFILHRKMCLCDNEVVIMFDFSENYSYVVQNASQAFHFNNTQCTVFPVIYYYNDNNEIKSKSCVFLSESVKHDTAAVYTIQRQLIALLNLNIKNLKRIIYITDGAKQHFKNRFQMANLINHKEDFGIEAEWHFSATAHGKSAVDGIGATFKREAYRSSLLAKPSDAILTSQDLYTWAKKHFKTIQILYFSKTEHNKMSRKLNKRFDSAPAIPDIMKNHSFSVIAENTLLIKRFSNDVEGVQFCYKTT